MQDGCVESARLFYLHVKKSLNDLGFKENNYDKCVFNKTIDKTQITVGIHVDDLIISCEKQHQIDILINELTNIYKRVKVQRDGTLKYLGMKFIIDGDKIKVDMSDYIKEILQENNITGVASTPANCNLFNIHDNSILLNNSEKELFHTNVAKLLYLAKRSRPDILTAVTFLTGRVTCATQEDNFKLNRIFNYLHGTLDITLQLTGSKDMNIEAFIDSSFAVHQSAKSHTGGVITIGNGVVHCKSSKQKLNSKSSTEAELIGLSDYLPQVIWTISSRLC